MNKEKIIEYVESNINLLNESEIFQEKHFNSVVEQFLFNTARRLLHTKNAYVNNQCGFSDFLASLRNFLITYKTSISINSINIPLDNDFGIYKDVINGNYYAAYDVPQFIDHKKFVNETFIKSDTEEPINKSKYLLKTNTFIENLTGFKYFKSLEQKLCVYGALRTPLGFTSLISMPTGGGKSLVTQLLAYEKKGLTIVVVPTVSLAIDQERNAKKNILGSKKNEIFYYHSGSKEFSDIVKAIRSQKAKLLFISPEALIKNGKFKELIEEANEKKYIKNLVIDEAHIVVSWGDFFRVDYQCLSPWRDELLKTTPEIRTYLLSATYQDITVKTLKRMFSIDEKWLEIRCDSLRKEPYFIFHKEKNFNEKKKNVLSLVNKLPRPMILYVNAPYEAKKWKSILEAEGYGNVHLFTGETKSEERNTLIEQWTNDEFELMVATSAFGVGVDKPDVRTVIHLYVPESPDSYYQELGRGGRDGLRCLSVMCVTDNDIKEATDHIGKVLTTEKLWGRWWSMFKNPSNIWMKDYITIMTSTKPNYNRTNDFDEGNGADEKWNINVLLLLNRYELIDIVGLDLDPSNRYVFNIKIRNELIVQDDRKAVLLFEEIRNKESERKKKTFSLVKGAIDKEKDICWSSMFYETYPLVSEYCCGCNAHETLEADELNKFPLLFSVDGPEKKISSEILTYFSHTNELLVISNSKLDYLLNKYNPDILVCDKGEEESTNSPKFNFMNFVEFKDLLAKDNGFYISGLIMVVYSVDDKIARKQYQVISKVLNKYKDKYVIHVSNHDFCVTVSNGKKISDYVKGSVIG